MRLLIHVEGETEEAFVNELLRGHLLQFGYELVSARIVGNARQRDRRGGIRAWSSVRGDIVRHLKEDAGCVATTMVDYYGLPGTGGRAWPGRAAAGGLPAPAKANAVESAIAEDVATAMGWSAAQRRRFVPFVVMHEYEGLLFSDCAEFAAAIGQPRLAGKFQAIRDAFENPEEINDAPETAPSRRVSGLVNGYEKPLFGVLGAIGVGLANIRDECPHFDQWVTALENLNRDVAPQVQG
jgi:hypothetical protein